MKNIAEILRLMAINEGAYCSIITQWDDPDTATLAQKYIEGIDFCIEHDFPSNEFLKTHFGSQMQQYGIFVDEKVYGKNLRHLVVNGQSKGKVSYDGCAFGKIYVRHKSHLEIDIYDDSIVNVEVYDKSMVTICNKGEKKACVYLYGGKIKIKGNVVIKDKRFQTQ